MAKNENTQEEEATEITVRPIINWSIVPSADEVIDLEQFAPPILKPREHFGEVFGLVDYTEMSGEMGDWLLVEVYDPVSGEYVYMSTGAFPAMKAIKALVDMGATPCMISFEQLGRSYKVVGVK